MAKAKKVDLDALLLANNTKGKKANSIPEIDSSKALADEVAKAYEAFKDAETAFKRAEDQLLVFAKAKYEQFAKDGSFTKSLNYTGDETEGVQVSFQDRFVDISIDEHPELLQEYGDYFEKKRELKLKKTDDATISQIAEKLGSELFLSVFDIKVSIAGKEGLDRKQFALPEAVRAEVQQYKGSVKRRK